jgi:hypothetical protein
MPTFRRNILLHLEDWSGEAPLPSFATSALKMEAVCYSETLASTDESTRRQNLEEHPHRRESLKSHKLVDIHVYTRPRKSTVMNHRVSWKPGNILTSWANISFWKSVRSMELEGKILTVCPSVFWFLAWLIMNVSVTDTNWWFWEPV